MQDVCDHCFNTINQVSSGTKNLISYRITHTTTYSYSDTVATSHNVVYLAPRNTANQRRLMFRIAVKPIASVTSGFDEFGNERGFFQVLGSHQQLSIKATSRVDVSTPQTLDPALSPAWESVRSQLAESLEADSLAARQFVFASPLVSHNDSLRRYALPSFPPGRPILQAALDLTARIYTDFQYDTHATHVNSTLDEVFEMKRGVCQDFAHLQAGCFREMGLAARYVSGYLRTMPPAGEKRMEGADASHAWVSVYCGRDGWVDLDPTNNLIANENHITTAWGRDYSDVCPIKGVFVGGGYHRMHVSVDVEPLEEL